MTDEALLKLKTLRSEPASPEARKLALNAAMVAFDAAHAKSAHRGSATSPRWLNRWSLATGLAGLGTAVAALVLLPLGTQLYTSTAPTVQPPVVPGGQVSIAAAKPAVPDKDVVTSVVATSANVPAAPDDTAKTELKLQSTGGLATRQVTTIAMPTAKANVEAPPPAADAVAQTAPADEEGEADLMPVDSNEGADLAAMPAPMPATAGALGYAATQPSGDTFQKFDENRLKVVADDPVSTFSIDVDTASYSYARGLIESGSLPEPDAVRLEEMINYFPYDYPAPATADTPFKATMAVIPTPWNKKTELLEIGIKGYEPPPAARQPENLTFLIDTSGSMDEPNKLPLLKRSFGLLVDNLMPTDTVSIVTYAGSAGVVLPPTKAGDKAAILSALDNLEAGGSTAGAEGIELAYQVAAQSRIANGVNRVILATDGDFNVGIDTPDQLKTFIKTKRDEGIFLSVLGFGRGNLDDALMQALAQNGNGNASYIDNLHEAQKVLVEEAGANFVTIAKDVKVQVEFNPVQVSEYRLIGYETRALNREDFNNDAVDAGEIGAGHTVTALYEITPAGSDGELVDPLRYGAASTPPEGIATELGYLKIRYKAPDGDVSKLISAPITPNLVVRDLAAAGNDQRFAAAVAAFGQKLRGSAYGETMGWSQIVDLANGAKGADPDGYRAEFVQMVKLAALLAPDHAGDGKAVGDAPDSGKPSLAPAD